MQQLLVRLANGRYFIWLLLALPAVWFTVRFQREIIYYGEYLHVTGEWSARLLILTLALTPLRLMFPRARWVRWFLARRRYFGVAVFGYALLHTLAYLQRKGSLALIADEATQAALWTGWVAFVIMLALALSSNDFSVRRLGRRWKWLHRTVYAAALLTFVHWILAAFDPVPGAIHLGVLAALEAYRLWRVYGSRLDLSRGTPSR